MDFDDDDQDFFSRVDHEDEPMGMEEPSEQPYEEMLPPEDEDPMGMDESSFQPSEELSSPSSRSDASDTVCAGPNPLPLLETDTSPSTAETNLPVRVERAGRHETSRALGSLQ